MATTKEMIDDAELAKSYISNSNMSDDYKRAYFKLINITTLATNGITPEEKIQKMTEAIQLLAVTQGMYMVNIENRIQEQVAKANETKCNECVAMKHALKVQKEEHDKEILEEYKREMGIKDEDESSKSWSDVLKTVLMKPYIYVVLCLMTISPFGVEIIKQIFQFYAK